AAPWYQHTGDFESRLDTTAMITGFLHKHRVTHPWRDTATAYCWKQIDGLKWTDPHQAIAVCNFLQHVPDRQRAMEAFTRLSTKIRAVIDVHPRSTGHVHTPLDLAVRPDHIARPLFTDEEIERNLQAFEEQQRPDGGWDACWDHWDTCATIEREGMRTIQRLRILRDYGHVQADRPRPRREAPGDGSPAQRRKAHTGLPQSTRRRRAPRTRAPARHGSNRRQGRPTVLPQPGQHTLQHHGIG